MKFDVTKFDISSLSYLQLYRSKWFSVGTFQSNHFFQAITIYNMRQAYELLLLCYGKASNVKDKKKTNKQKHTNKQTNQTKTKENIQTSERRKQYIRSIKYGKKFSFGKQ